MRRCLALALVVALPSAALWDPFVHAHFDGDHATEHHHGRVIHGHTGSHPLDDPHRLPGSLFEGDEEEEARSLTTFVARTAHVAPPLPAIAVAAGIVAIPPPAIARLVSFTTRNHDPPSIRIDRLRAPPPLRLT